MTPEEWERCTHLDEMLEFLRASGRASSRKLRLFGVACCRRIWPYLTTDQARHAVEVSERYADRRAKRSELIAAYGATTGRSHAELAAGWSARLGAKAPRLAAAFAAVAACPQVGPVERDLGTRLDPPFRPPPEEVAREQRCQCDLLRDICGNPFRPPPVIAPAVLAHNGGAARRLAEAIYPARRFEDLPVLADLLEEAGLTDAGLLGHLRGPGPHCLGCWALDAVLGKS
jgi:hypothetical protein